MTCIDFVYTQVQESI